jgi:hypothetical protein
MVCNCVSCGDAMLEMLELSSRPASSAKPDSRRRAMRVSEASTADAGPPVLQP